MGSQRSYVSRRAAVTGCGPAPAFHVESLCLFVPCTFPCSCQVPSFPSCRSCNLWHWHWHLPSSPPSVSQQIFAFAVFPLFLSASTPCCWLLHDYSTLLACLLPDSPFSIFTPWSLLVHFRLSFLRPGHMIGEILSLSLRFPLIATDPTLTAVINCCVLSFSIFIV